MKTSLLAVSILTLCFTVLACNPTDANSADGGSGGSSGTAGSNGSGGSAGTGGSPGSGGSHGKACMVADNCPNIACDCSNGPVNSRKCINEFCLLPADSCPGSCQAFGATWNGTSSITDQGSGGTSGTGGGGGSGSGGSAACGASGAGCLGDADCCSNACDAFGLCI